MFKTTTFIRFFTRDALSWSLIRSWMRWDRNWRTSQISCLRPSSFCSFFLVSLLVLKVIFLFLVFLKGLLRIIYFWLLKQIQVSFRSLGFPFVFLVFPVLRFPLVFPFGALASLVALSWKGVRVCLEKSEEKRRYGNSRRITKAFLFHFYRILHT